MSDYRISDATKLPDLILGCNVVAVALVLLTVPIFAALMRIPFVIIAPLMVIIYVVAATRCRTPISTS